MKYTSINERYLRIANELYGGNKSALSKSIGVSPTVVENILGTRKGNPGFDVLQKTIYANANINPEWLMTGQGEMLKSEKSLTATTPTKPSTLVKEDNPLLDYLQNENKELKEEISTLNAENKALNKEIGKLEGKLEDACELIESLKKEIPVPGFLRAAR